MRLFRPVRVALVLLALVILWASAHAAKDSWCIRKLDTPIFGEGDLRGQPDRIISKLGRPAKRLRMRAGSLLSIEALRRLFNSADLRRLGNRELNILLWDKTCLGSTLWRFAVITDGESYRILAVGGESSYQAPVYLGGGSVAQP
jgi:hypothetical protein